jgi:N-acetylglucosamine-6-phosphate deacetylase
MSPGRYNVLGNDVILEENGRVYNPVAGHLVGSAAAMLQCMNHLASLKLLTAEQLLAVGFHNPLKLLGIGPDDIAPGTNLSFDEKRNVITLDK